MTHSSELMANAGKPDYVALLEAAYGPPSQEGFGSATFFEPLLPTDDLEQAALGKYRLFVGDLWERWGEEAWMRPWKKAYARPAGGSRDIVNELRRMEDRGARMSAGVLLDNVDDAERGHAALAAAFDDPTVSELVIYTVGDGEAMSGLLIAARRGDHSATFLAFLLD